MNPESTPLLPPNPKPKPKPRLPPNMPPLVLLVLFPHPESIELPEKLPASLNVLKLG